MQEITDVMSVVDWIDERKEFAQLKTNRIPLSEVKEWIINSDGMEHNTKRFFSVIGVESYDKASGDVVASQPIIDQPEIGLLGFILAASEDGLKILLQAKTEPGNINGTQIGPSVQATFSNYMRVHEGKATEHLNYFIEEGVLISEGSLQSEQGTRFYGKYNRNVSTFIESDKLIPEYGNWKWFLVKDVLSMLDEDYYINTDARSVLVCSDWNKLSENGVPFSVNIGEQNFGEDLYKSFNQTSSSFQPNLDDIPKLLEAKRAAVNHVTKQQSFDLLEDGWFLDKGKIGKPGVFSVSGISVSVKGREIGAWDQPLLESHCRGTVVFYCKKLDGVLHFLVGYSSEIGFKEDIQFGPSVMNLDNQSFQDLKLNKEHVKTIASYSQSDEGGRFYQSVVDYYLKEISSEEEVSLGDTHIWMTLGQIYTLLPVKGNFTNEFRSVLSLILKHL